MFENRAWSGGAMVTDDLTGWRIKHMADLAKAAEPGNTATIYHYTNVTGALAILRSGRLWFTERVHLNDPSEVVHSIEIARKALLSSNAAQNNDTLYKAFSEEIKSQHEKSDFYIASFSKNHNDLGQWRGYADDGRGVALGFSFDVLKEFPKCRKMDAFHPWQSKFMVNYSPNNLGEKFQAIATEAVNFCERQNISSVIVQPDRPYPPQAVAMELFRIAQFGGLMNKHKAYEPEQEIRFLYWCNSGITLSKHSHGHTPCINIDVRERNGELVRYLDVPIPQWGERGTLTHIWLGPASAPSLEGQLRALCTQLTIPEPCIEKSDIPYRSTRQT